MAITTKPVAGQRRQGGDGMVLAGAADTLEIVVGMLLVSVTSYTLAAYHRASAAAVEAAMRYFLSGALTNAILLIGFVILYGTTGTTNLAATGTALASGADPLRWSPSWSA